MFRTGMMPVMFMTEDQEEDRHQDRQEALAVLLAERSSTMLLADEVEAHLDDGSGRGRGRASCGGCRARRSRGSATTTRNRISMTRLISNGVPSNSMTGGKNSSIEGPWKPPSSSAATIGTSRCRALASSAISCFGASSSALATTNVGNGIPHMPTAGRHAWGIVDTLARLLRADESEPAQSSVGASAAATSLDVRARGTARRPATSTTSEPMTPATTAEEEHVGFEPRLLAQHDHEHDEDDELEHPAAEHDPEEHGRSSVVARCEPVGDRMLTAVMPEEDDRHERPDERAHEPGRRRRRGSR